MDRSHGSPRREVPANGPDQSRTYKTAARQNRAANYEAAKRAALLAGLRHCVPLLDVLGGLHVHTSPERAAVHPSQEWLADQLGCAVSTVRAQLDALAAAGILDRHVATATPTGDGGRFVRRTNRYWLLLGRIWGRIRAGRAYRRLTGGHVPLRGAESLGGADPSPPPTPSGAPPRLFDPPEPEWTPPDAAERARVKAALAALRGVTA